MRSRRSAAESLPGALRRNDRKAPGGRAPRTRPCEASARAGLPAAALQPLDHLAAPVARPMGARPDDRRPGGLGAPPAHGPDGDLEEIGQLLLCEQLVFLPLSLGHRPPYPHPECSPASSFDTLRLAGYHA